MTLQNKFQLINLVFTPGCDGGEAIHMLEQLDTACVETIAKLDS